MKALAAEGYTMVVVTHEMDFARPVSNEVVFLEKGLLIEKAPPEKFFTQPPNASGSFCKAAVSPACIPCRYRRQGCVGFRLIPVDSERLPRLTHRHHLHRLMFICAGSVAI